MSEKVTSGSLLMKSSSAAPSGAAMLESMTIDDRPRGLRDYDDLGRFICGSVSYVRVELDSTPARLARSWILLQHGLQEKLDSTPARHAMQRTFYPFFNRS
jgi:hypothetical protein